MAAIFEFPEDARWDEEADCVVFGVRLGEYAGQVFVPRRVVQGLIGARPSPEACLQYFHLNRTSFERIAEAKLRDRQLDDTANLRVTGRDLRRLRE